jgi:hypothetical protein
MQTPCGASTFISGKRTGLPAHSSKEVTAVEPPVQMRIAHFTAASDRNASAAWRTLRRSKSGGSLPIRRQVKLRDGSSATAAPRSSWWWWCRRHPVFARVDGLPVPANSVGSSNSISSQDVAQADRTIEHGRQHAGGQRAFAVPQDRDAQVRSGSIATTPR